MKTFEAQGMQRGLLAGALVLLFAYALWRTAWVSDDAYITLRSVDNLVNGYGMTWNAGERVQAFTHPLWYFVLAVVYFFTREAYYTTAIVCMMISLAAFCVLAFKHAWPTVLPAGLVLILSKAYVDYSTSGLENPLTHLLLVLFVLGFLEDQPQEEQAGRMGLLAGLLVLTRMDLLLMVLPALILLIWTADRRLNVAARVAAGFIPFALWELFSVIYFGFPFPNTAYAKLNAWIPRSELLLQGAYYFLNSLAWDPLTLVTTAFGTGTALLTRQGRPAALAVGIFSYLLYVIWIGGDFMSGRFFTPPLVVAVSLLLNRFKDPRAVQVMAASAIVLALGLLSATPSLSWTAPVKATRWEWVDEHLIADERLYYFETAGLVNTQPGLQQPREEAALRGMEYRQAGPAVVTELQVGYLGYFAGPDVYVIDRNALGDPLLARIPFRDEEWRIGHLTRKVPRGYEQTLLSGENRIQDARLAEYYSALQLIVRGELFTRARWAAIWRMNTGQYNDLIQAYMDASQ